MRLLELRLSSLRASTRGAFTQVIAPRGRMLMPMRTSG